MDVDESSFPSVFYFANDSKELHKLVLQFECAKAIGNIYQFYRSYKMLIGKIKEGGLDRDWETFYNFYRTGKYSQ